MLVYSNNIIDWFILVHTHKCNRHHDHLIEHVEYNLFSPCYTSSWKIAHLGLNDNHSLTYYDYEEKKHTVLSQLVARWMIIRSKNCPYKLFVFCFLNVDYNILSCRFLYWDMIWYEILNLKRVCYTEMSENIPQPPPPPMIPHTPSQVPIPSKITRQTTFVTQISSTEDIRLAMYERLKKNVYVLGSI